MKLLNLYSGTGSVSKPWKEKGYEVYNVDVDPDFPPISAATYYNGIIRNYISYQMSYGPVRLAINTLVREPLVGLGTSD